MEDDGSRFATDGYAVVDVVLSRNEVAALQRVVDTRLDASFEPAHRRRAAVYGVRGLLRVVPELRELAAHPAVQRLVDERLAGAELVRGILFDKSGDANWGVPWHQDLTIPVHEKIDVPGFGPWSSKENVPHVQPPVAFLERMLTLRLHLDDCPATAGPLRVLPGTHRHGKLSAAERDAFIRRVDPVACVTSAGGAVLMSPLTLHSSQRSHSTQGRRVLHLEFAAEPLPSPLCWYERDDSVG